MFRFFKRNRRKPEAKVDEKPVWEDNYMGPGIDEKGRTLATEAEQENTDFAEKLHFEVTFRVTEVHTDETIGRNE